MPVTDLKCNILEQYRQSNNLLNIIEAGLLTVEESETLAIDSGEYIPLDVATGLQLDHIGEAVGLAREQCNARTSQYFGFIDGTNECFNPSEIGGLYDPSYTPEEFDTYNVWEGTGGTGAGLTNYRFTDTEYRKYIRAKVLANYGSGSVQDILDAVGAIYATPTYMLANGGGTMIVGVERRFTEDEIALHPLVSNIVSAMPNVTIKLADVGSGSIIGFGNGWGDFCTGSFPRVFNY